MMIKKNDVAVLGCDTMWIWRKVPIFLRNIGSANEFTWCQTQNNNIVIFTIVRNSNLT